MPTLISRCFSVGLTVATFTAFVASPASAQVQDDRQGLSAMTWDATADFSTESNTASVWTYGTTGPTLDVSAFIPFTHLVAENERHHWGLGYSGNPHMGKVGSSDWICCEGNVDIPANTLFAHPGYQNDYAILRFIPPEPGKYQVTASFWGDDHTPTTTDVHVLTNTDSLFSADIETYGEDTKQTYSDSVLLPEEGALYFAIGVGSNDHYFWDSTGFSVTITEEVEVGNKQPIEVTIDVRPDSDENTVVPRARGNLPVAVLGSASLDVTTINAATARFGATGQEESVGNYNIYDVNADGFSDLVLEAKTETTGIQPGMEIAKFTATTTTGASLEGRDMIRTRGQ